MSVVAVPALLGPVLGPVIGGAHRRRHLVALDLLRQPAHGRAGPARRLALARARRAAPPRRADRRRRGCAPVARPRGVRLRRLRGGHRRPRRHARGRRDGGRGGACRGLRASTRCARATRCSTCGSSPTACSRRRAWRWPCSAATLFAVMLLFPLYEQAARGAERPGRGPADGASGAGGDGGDAGGREAQRSARTARPGARRRGRRGARDDRLHAGLGRTRARRCSRCRWPPAGSGWASSWRR